MVFISPAKLEIQLRRLENRFSEFCAIRLSWATPFAAALLVVLALWIKYLLEQSPDFLQGGLFQIARQGRFTFPLILGFSAFTIFIRGHYRVAYNAFVTLAAWSWSCYFLFWKHVPLDVFWVLSASFPFLAMLTYFIGKARRRNVSRTMRVGLLILGFAGLWLYVSNRLYSLGQYHMLLLFWRFKLQYLVLVAIQMAYAYSPRPVDPFSAFNPAPVARAILWPVDTLLATKNREAIRRFWWKGFLGVVIGYALIYAKITLDEMNFAQSRNVYLAATSRYFLIILADVGVLNIVIGIARVFGHRVRDATNFCWLARTPAEYWRRGSVFHYEFVNRYLFRRLWRVFHNRFIVTFICFLFFYIMKNGMLEFSIWTFDFFGMKASAGTFQKVGLKYPMTLFLMHFALLYITQRHWFFNWEDHRAVWKPWCSVLLTYILQIGALVIALKISRGQ